MSFHFQNVALFQNGFSFSKCESFPEKLKQSSQILCGTRSFTNCLWHVVISNSLWHAVISNFLWHAVIYKFPVARGHFKLRINHFSKKMLSFSKWVSGWAFIFKMWFFFEMCFHFQNVKGFESFFFHFSEKNCLGSFMYRGS